ncbi:hypothetical protein ILUMI_11396 [Ignelater luminosus]|uniref:Alpha-N-acetylglucosaminidase n=1 Tax=Ignelater luminosus TaxID=2038154 RepID=A0A8K0D0C0_IGNLU|nr:hypothetical protein ILUMI_11396 [Ignelater luminosus]
MFIPDASVDDLQSSSSPEIQAKAVSDLINRLIPDNARAFYISIDPTLGPEKRDTFQLERQSNGTVRIIGNTGIAAATGFHHYLKYYCSCHISWEASNLNLPENLPDVNITITSNDRFRYYQNVCTTSYSFVWWSWEQWEKHIDWMALNSFNLVLAFNGQEAIWQKIYNSLNLTSAQIDEHFTGPAFLSWERMGNIRGWGGPLSEAWHNRSIALQHKILNRMRSLGMITILPAFAGHVPRAFKEIFPNAKMVKTNTWNGFTDTYCCPYLLDPTDPLFQTVGGMFLSELIAEFGTDHAYNCDTFNEMLPVSGNVTYINEMGKSVYSAIESVDRQGVWVMQNWLFVNEFIFWTKERAKALLTSAPIGKMIVLDLQSEQHPQYVRLNSYYGQPYIWCMLHNFGGTLGMFGSVDIINKEVVAARNKPNSTLIGTGLTPEGINQNYVVYDLMNEMGWRKEPSDLNEWFTNYVTRRYGQNESSAVAAWQILKSTVYNYTGLLPMRGKYAITRRPSTRIITWTWYNSCDFLQAWDIFLQSAKTLRNSSAYLHDLVDITRQALQVLGDQYYNEIIKSFKDKQKENFWVSSQLFLELFTDMDLILKTREAFLLGRWLSSAKAAAANDEDEKLFEYNARNQITLWGPNGEITDYANKQWSGIVSHYFQPRWSLFLKGMGESLANGSSFPEKQILRKIFKEVEEPFTFDRSVFPDIPSGDTVEIAKRIHEKWWERIHCRYPRSEEYTSEQNMNTEDLLAIYEEESSVPRVYVVT